MLAEAGPGHEAAHGAGVVEPVAVQHHTSGGDDDGGPARERPAVERGEVSAHVQRAAVDDAFLGRIEDDQIGVEPGRDGALARKGVDAGRAGGEDFDEVLHPGLAGRFPQGGEGDGHPRFDAGEPVRHFADVVRALPLLREVVAGVVGRDGVDGAVGQPFPERGDGLRAAHRRAAGVPLGHHRSVDAVVEGEIVRAGLGVGLLPPGAGLADQIHGAGGGLVHKVDGGAGVFGHGQGFLDRDLFGQFGAGAVQVFDADPAVVRVLPGAVRDDGVVLGVDVGEAVQADHLAHDLQDRVPVSHGGAAVGGVHLDGPDALGGELLQLPWHRFVPLDHRPVQRDVAAGLAGQFLLVQDRCERGLAGVAGDAEVDDRGGPAPQSGRRGGPVVIEGAEPPGDLGYVAVPVDAAGNDQQAGGIDDAVRVRDRLGGVHQPVDAAVPDHNVGLLAAETVDHGAVGDDEIWGVGHRCPPRLK